MGRAALQGRPSNNRVTDCRATTIRAVQPVPRGRPGRRQREEAGLESHPPHASAGDPSPALTSVDVPSGPYAQPGTLARQPAKVIRQRLLAVLEWAIAMDLRLRQLVRSARAGAGSLAHYRAVSAGAPARGGRTGASPRCRSPRRGRVEKLAFEFLVLTSARIWEVRFVDLGRDRRGCRRTEVSEIPGQKCLIPPRVPERQAWIASGLSDGRQNGCRGCPSFQTSCVFRSISRNSSKVVTVLRAEGGQPPVVDHQHVGFGRATRAASGSRPSARAMASALSSWDTTEVQRGVSVAAGAVGEGARHPALSTPVGPQIRTLKCSRSHVRRRARGLVACRAREGDGSSMQASCLSLARCSRLVSCREVGAR